MSIDSSSDLEELFRLNITFDISNGLTIETRNISDRARKVRQATAVTKWRNTTCLGQGASGVVWLQQEEEVPEKCRAIKEIPKGTMSAPLPVDYRRELLALGRLSKREDLFVRFLGWYEDIRSVYLAMEYFELGDLGRHLSARLAEDEVRVISKQLLEGLAVLHGQNWAHRDLKPPNIFVVDTSPWWVKIGDFGISKRIRSGNTRFQTMIGTPDFVAPEVLNLVSEANDEDTSDTEDEYTVAVDMWSLGCVIFQLLTLETPFANRKKLGSYCRSKLEKFPLEPLRGAAVSDAAIGIIRGLLEPIPSHRRTADAALRCEWIQGVQEPSENEPGSYKLSEDIDCNSKARRDSVTVADAAISSGAWEAQTAGQNEGFQSGPAKIETFESDTATTPWYDLEPREQVRTNSFEHSSNESDKPRVLENPPSDVAKNEPSRHGNGLQSVSAILDQQRRSISRNSQGPRTLLLPPASSSPLTKPPSMRKSGPREAKVNSLVGPNLMGPPSWGHRDAEQIEYALRDNDASHHREASSTANGASYEPLSTSKSLPDEPVLDPPLVGAFEELSTIEQRPKAGNPAPKPFFFTEAKGPIIFCFVFGLEKKQSINGPLNVKQVQNKSTPKTPTVAVPPVSIEERSTVGELKSGHLQRPGTRKALLISINHYVRNGQLKTNIRDVKATADYLSRALDCSMADVALLTRNYCSASKKDVIGALMWFLKEVNAGDTRFLHFSGSVMFDELFEPLTHSIPKAARFTVLVDTSVSVVPFRLEYVYEPREYRLTHSTLFPTKARTDNAQKTEGDIVVWYCSYQSPSVPGNFPPLSQDFIALHQSSRVAQSTLTYIDMLEALQKVSNGESKRTAVLASNHPLDLDSPLVM